MSDPTADEARAGGSGWSTRVPVPTWRAVLVALALALAPLVVDLPAVHVLAVANGALLAALVVDANLAPRPDRLRVRREIPDVVPLHASGSITWSVHNPLDRALRVALADDLPPSLRAVTRRAHFRIPPRARTESSTTFRPARRGRVDLPAVTVRVSGPLGLAARQARVSCESRMRVYPSFRSRAEAALRLDRERLLEVGTRSARGRGGGTEFESLREYGVDDEFRRIDWAATSRAGRPIVREYRAERNQPLLFLLDTGRTMAARLADSRDASPDVPRLDHAMDVVMAVTTVATRIGDRVGLVAFAGAVRRVVAPSRGPRQLERITGAMYDLEPRLEESDYRAAFLAALSRFPRHGLLVVLTELAEGAVTETLFPALPLVLRDRVLLVASVRDARLEEWARARPGDAATAFRKAAAVRRLDVRDRLAGNLRHTGATVVDAAPEDLPRRTVDAYLDMKARGRV